MSNGKPPPSIERPIQIILRQLHCLQQLASPRKMSRDCRRQRAAGAVIVLRLYACSGKRLHGAICKQIIRALRPRTMSALDEHRFRARFQDRRGLMIDVRFGLRYRRAG